VQVKKDGPNAAKLLGHGCTKGTLFWEVRRWKRSALRFEVALFERIGQ
jgi:hypothetical protein